MSNGIDREGATLWPKVTQASSDFGALLQSLSPETPEAELIEQLFDLLAWVLSFFFQSRHFIYPPLLDSLSFISQISVVPSAYRF